MALKSDIVLLSARILAFLSFTPSMDHMEQHSREFRLLFICVVCVPMSPGPRQSTMKYELTLAWANLPTPPEIYYTISKNYFWRLSLSLSLSLRRVCMLQLYMHLAIWH